MERFSTRSIVPSGRMGYWRDVVGQFFGDVTYASDSPEQFQGELSVTPGDSFSAFQFDTIAPHQIHSPSQPDACVHILSLFDGNCRLSHRGNRCVLSPRDFVVIDSKEVFELSVPGPVNGCVLSIPVGVAPRELTRPLGLAGVLIDGSQGMGAVTSDFIRSLAIHAERLEESDATRMLACLLDLLNSAALSNVGKTQWPTSRHRAFQLQKIHLYIENKLRDPALLPQSIAAAHGLSGRYLNKLFEGGGITVMRYIWRQRLERCRRDLADELQSDKSITAIAYSWGFSSSTHFNRTFKAQFDITPGQVRPAAIKSGLRYVRKK